ncbi:hypothetical protein [Cerasicoccus maritimus]|uniref:hypothetical protein n=1 Tax=Cerasicoccus maritimus TaxID=490089 RepID=UPI00285298AA|nr:hypothetical protein [Cerasicoccus maritimus]
MALQAKGGESYRSNFSWQVKSFNFLISPKPARNEPFKEHLNRYPKAAFQTPFEAALRGKGCRHWQEIFGWQEKVLTFFQLSNFARARPFKEHLNRYPKAAFQAPFEATLRGKGCRHWRKISGWQEKVLTFFNFPISLVRDLLKNI